MVLWEITLGTAYFLGLKRTYKLALKLQRRLISPKHERLRKFVHRRTRAVFDVAVKVHKNIQERDLEVGRNLGNRILRWLDRMKPSAHIRGPPTSEASNGARSFISMKNQGTNLKPTSNFQEPKHKDSDRHLFSSTKMWPKSVSSIAMMMRPPRPSGTGTHTQFRHIYSSAETGALVLRSNYPRGRCDGVMRKDIMQWLKM